MKLSKDELYHLYWCRGMSTREIGKLYDLSYSTILYYMRKYGIPRRRRGNSGKCKHRYLNFNGTQLLKAYIIGIVLADYSVERHKNMVRVKICSTKDETIKIAYELFSRFTDNILVLNTKTPRDKPERLVTFTLNKSFSFLLHVKHNWKQIIEKLETLYGEEIFWSFLAGLIDGDGSIIISKSGRWTKYRIYVIQKNKSMLENLAILLTKHGIKKHRITKKEIQKNIFRLEVYGKSDCVKIYSRILPYLRYKHKIERAKKILKETKAPRG